MSMDLILTIVALLLTASGILLLRVAWALPERQPMMLVPAWGLILLAVANWVVSSTADWGLAAALLALMGGGLVAISIAALRAPKDKGRERRVPKAQRLPISWRRGGRRLAVFLLAGPVAAAISLALCLWFYGAATAVSEQTRLAVTLFLLPLAWAVLALVATYDMPFFKRGAYLAAFGLPALLSTYGLF